MIRANVFLVAPFLLAAGLSATAVPPSPADVVASATPFINRANREWMHAIRTRDANALSHPYAEDALFIMPDGVTIKGRNAIHDLYAARPRTAAAIVAARVESVGRTSAGPEDVYEWGSAWTIVHSPDGTSTRRGGRYLTVWHRYPDRHWSIIRNMVF